MTALERPVGTITCLLGLSVASLSAGSTALAMSPGIDHRLAVGTAVSVPVRRTCPVQDGGRDLLRRSAGFPNTDVIGMGVLNTPADSPDHNIGMGIPSGPALEAPTAGSALGQCGGQAQETQSLRRIRAPRAGLGHSSALHAAVDDEAAWSGRATTGTGSLAGSIQGFRLAGVEPDGDPLYQVVLQTRLGPSRPHGSRTTGHTEIIPYLNLIVSAYLENFKPDTTPVLPDLLHPNKTAHNLGGFLQGKVLLTDDAGNVISIGSFLAEAFLDNSNHAVMRLFPTKGGAGGSLKGTFTLSSKGALTGAMTGRITLSGPARAQIERTRGKKMRSLKDIISTVTVTPHYYGTTASGQSGPPLHTGFGGSAPGAGSSGGGSRSLSPVTIIAGIGAVLSLLLAGVLYLLERRRKSTTAAVDHSG